MEKQVAELESQKQEMAETNKELQKAMERLSAELKNKPGPGGPDQNLLSKLAELEAQLKKEAQEKAMLQEKLTKAEASKGPVGPTEADMEEQARLMALLEAKLKAEQDRATQAERKMKEQASELAKIKGQPPKTVAATGGPAKVVEHEVDNSEELDALQKEMDAESRRADKLSKENKDLQAELERLRKMNEELRNAEPETRVVEVQREVSDKDSDDDDKSPGRNGPRPSQLARDEEARKMRTKMPGSDDHLEASGGGKAAFSQAMWDEKVAELNKANKKVMTQKDTIRELKEENAGLNERCDKMLKMLHQLKEQLKRVTEIAEARGCGDLVKSILEDAGVTQTLNSEEFTCFDRLYEDAKRRMEKQRTWDEQRMGLRPKSPMQERARAMLNNRAWAPGGAQQFSMTDPGPGYGAVQGYGFGEPSAPTITPGPFVSPGMGQTAPQMSMPMNSAGATLKISDSGSLYGPASQWCPTEKNSMPAPMKPGGQSPTAQAGQHISPASMAYLQNRGGDFMAEAGEYDFDMGMHVVGFAPGAGSRPGSTQTDPNSRANTPGGARRAGSPLGGAARSAPIDPSKPVMARKRFANSQSLTSLSAMALDVQGSSPLAANDRVSNAVPNRRKIIDSSKTLGRLDDMKPSAGMMMDDGSPILIPANNIWAGINHGEFSDRPKGPGMFRGFKLVGSRSQHDLSPLQGGIPNAFQCRLVRHLRSQEHIVCAERPFQ